MSYNLTTLETGLTPPRLGNLITYSHFCHELPGAFAEFGVMKGGSLELLAKLHPEREIYGIDGFEGLPKPTIEDVHKQGEFALSNDEYEALRAHFDNCCMNVRILRGYSPKIFESIPNDETFAFVHIDVDLFRSVGDALNYFFKRMVPGGMMLFDDFGYITTPGATKALLQWDKPCTWKGELRFANNIFGGQYLIIK